MQSVGLLFKVFWSPGEAMFLISKSPRVLAPMLFLSLFSCIAGSAVLMKVDSAELNMRMLERSIGGRNLSDEQKAQLREQAYARMNSPLAKTISFISTAVFQLVIVVLVATIFFALFTMLGREGGFKAFLSITAFAFLPSVFRQLATVLTAFFVPSSAIMPDELGSLSPSVFLDRDSVSPVLFAGMSTLDVVSIWILLLLIIGYGYVTRKSLSKSARASAVVVVFLVYVAARLSVAGWFGV
jgi:Yip1-like protein